MPAERRGAITGAFAGFLSTTETSTSINNDNFNNTGTMAFNFGSTPAPAPGGAPAPAPFSFGAPAPAPAGGAFNFGSSPAPAPSTGGFSFGNTPAPAPSTGGLFGAPSTGSLFGTPAPAPGGSLFGAAAPASSSLYGAPAPSTGAFGAPAPAPYGQPAPAQAPPPALAGHMQYSNLSPDQKQAIDRLYQAMMQHKRTILQVSTMAPKLLGKPQQADVAAGSQDLPLVPHVQKLNAQVEQLQQQLQTLRQNADYTRELYETSTSHAFMFAQWPTEAVAVRRGVTISKPKITMDKDTQNTLRELLDRQLSHVDRVERMPSPYLWQTLEDMEQRIRALKGQMESLNTALESSTQISPESSDVITILRMQDQAIWKIASALAAVDAEVNQVRHEYRLFERGTNVIDEADQEERQHQQYLDHKLREQMVKSLPAAGTPKPGAPSPGGGMFGSAPAPSSGLFGAPSPAPGAFSFSAPAPSSSGLFGSNPAPAPSGSLFGLGPAPAPSGGLFGSTPAPAPGGSSLFGSNPASAPAFGAAPAPSTGGFSFGGSTPALGAFGATPAPAPAFGGFASASSTPSTPKAKNKSRSTRRR